MIVDKKETVSFSFANIGANPLLAATTTSKSPQFHPPPRAHCLLDCCHWVASHCTAAPDSSAAAPRVPKNKNSEVARRHPDRLGTEHTTQSFSGC